MRDDTLEDFEARDVTLEERTRRVYVAGEGPAVIVLPEMPGISPEVARFARWVRDAGLSVYMPSLFGRDGAVPQADEGAKVFQRACVSAEFNALQAGRASPVTTWLRALARLAHAERGGPGVGVIGMCFTGNFALTMTLEPSVLAPVLAQPSLPLGDPGGLESSAEELAAVRARLERDDLEVRALRFAGDPFCQAARFAAYQAALGPRFKPTVLPDEVAHPEPSPFFQAHVPRPHSALTAHLVDETGHPTVEARDAVLGFFREALLDE